MRTPIQDFLLSHAEKKMISFHMPGHKGAALYQRFGCEAFLTHMMDCDVTEIPGADNLFQAEGIIKETQERYARLYHVPKAYLLVNGTSGGIIAAVLACVPQGKQIIMARNCHKSVFNALTLAHITPIYAYPDMLEEYAVAGAVSPEQIEALLCAHPDAKAVILPSPNYYGICSDIQKIADIVHKYGKILIVDEAHGAHLSFFHQYGIKGMPQAAEHAGADIVIVSIHKTLASLTQSAVLLVASERVDLEILEDKLQCIQSTSPSYLLMASLDINASLLEEHGKRLFTEWEEGLRTFYEQAAKNPRLKLIGPGKGIDWSKLNFSLGIHGAELENVLREDFGIVAELYTGEWVMGMTGIGNTREDFRRLTHALAEIAARLEAARESGEGRAKQGAGRLAGQPVKADSTKTREAGAQCAGAPEQIRHETFRQTLTAGGAQEQTSQMRWQPESEWFGAQEPTRAGQGAFVIPLQRLDMAEIPRMKQKIALTKAEGRICASSIIPYPPGVPLVCPGERLDASTIEYIKRLRELGEKVIGVNERGEIMAGAASSDTDK